MSTLNTWSSFFHGLCLSHNIALATALTPVSRTPWKPFGSVKSKQNLEPYDYRAVSFTYSYYEQRFSSYNKYQGNTLLRFLIQITHVN